jgi:hypothetical protein
MELLEQEYREPSKQPLKYLLPWLELWISWSKRIIKQRLKTIPKGFPTSFLLLYYLCSSSNCEIPVEIRKCASKTGFHLTFGTCGGLWEQINKKLDLPSITAVLEGFKSMVDKIDPPLKDTAIIRSIKAATPKLGTKKQSSPSVVKQPEIVTIDDASSEGDKVDQEETDESEDTRPFKRRKHSNESSIENEEDTDHTTTTRTPSPQPVPTVTEELPIISDSTPPPPLSPVQEQIEENVQTSLQEQSPNVPSPTTPTEQSSNVVINEEAIEATPAPAIATTQVVSNSPKKRTRGSTKRSRARFEDFKYPSNHEEEEEQEESSNSRETTTKETSLNNMQVHSLSKQRAMALAHFLLRLVPVALQEKELDREFTNSEDHWIKLNDKLPLHDNR